MKNNKTRKILEICAFILFVTITLFSVSWLSYIFLPERNDYGAIWHKYLEEDENSIDVMFFGSSLVFCDIIPAEIYSESGITSYVLAAPESTIPYMYYYVKEALKTQKPKVIFAEVSGMYFDEYTNFTDITLGYMPYSENRISATITSAEKDAKIGLLFPLYNYHDRWEELSFSDYFRFKKDKSPDIWAGYTPLLETKTDADRILREVEHEKVNFEKNSEYLKKLVLLCEEKEIELELFIVPSCYTYSEENIEKIKSVVPESEFTDFNNIFDEDDYELSGDFYDRLHFNIFGAQKFSRFLGKYITEKYEISPCNHDKGLWESRVVHLSKNLAVITK